MIVKPPREKATAIDFTADPRTKRTTDQDFDHYLNFEDKLVDAHLLEANKALMKGDVRKYRRLTLGVRETAKEHAKDTETE